MQFVMVFISVLFSLPVLSADSRTAPPESIQKFQYETALRASQEAIGKTPADYPFTDERGRAQ